ncbi:putative Zn-dependent protease [Blastomonas natatoria]|uniref:Putative Zn-dependent protease n=1 Tax=Blastomonas natatoria TaxID=34015 RepID=A0A2V3UQ87_9SPHN|nr:M48 family metalloprotease [Blastomonas natatoria]PXW69535.1 putative Zn-dependent protease [Blastomonas natatoria]
MKLFAARMMAIWVLLVLVVQPVAAQSILRDAETEALLADMSRELILAAGLLPSNVNVVVINDRSINAFVAGTQDVYIHSGLIEAADSVNEVQGVIAHELGHIALGHSITRSESASKAGNITILSLLLGLAAVAAGAGEAGLGIIGAGQQAALGKFLAHTRGEEAGADVAGAKYLSAAGLTGKGSINFFKKLQNLEFRLAIPQEDSYNRSHPLSGERITLLQDIYENDPAYNRPVDPVLEARFQRVKAKLVGYVAEPTQTLRTYPETDQSVPARYARAYAWHKSAYPEKALSEVRSLLAQAPDDPYFLEIYGQILLESGRPKEAIAPLQKAVESTNAQSLIAGVYGHALIATEDPSNLPEAERVLKAAVARDAANPFAWYQLGVVYADRGDTARAALASAERYVLQGNAPLALQSAEQAMTTLPQGSADFIRAQDIAILARDAVERERRRR